MPSLDLARLHISESRLLVILTGRVFQEGPLAVSSVLKKTESNGFASVGSIACGTSFSQVMKARKV